jgi:hypothetical protein
MFLSFIDTPDKKGCHRFPRRNGGDATGFATKTAPEEPRSPLYSPKQPTDAVVLVGDQSPKCQRSIQEAIEPAIAQIPLQTCILTLCSEDYIDKSVSYPRSTTMLS